MIAIIDYGMGNLRSVQKGFECVGHEAVVTRDLPVIDRASHVVLPGVGAFGDCMDNLARFELMDVIYRSIASGKPFLGICLGFQLLFSESEEFGYHQGLGILAGKVKAIPRPSDDGETSFKIPHMGWNTIQVNTVAPPLRGIVTDSYVYFVHSYYVEPTDCALVSTHTDYGISFASSVWKDNVFATQWHPEKSQAVGLQVLKNFGDWQ
ncbi:imidazole glycerol phosphate synthase subunit HisH [Candidatus Nitrospira neomarina]|uniref:Imidazole glycerol phosphate synthase subunit HisH n=1 Tax=Candidatus Nitrospira neomarina TaxID=3020899 RepID=A0AA96GK60_9BACT|nr:imidazole glycerol phosphate synthase subunit HisH [Candidatus Nitrospira neomarina]WNM61745.1 imidazole glycerol phosphate synthase subunit HisH [Candidatus Nitrospira neomarina]